MIFTAAQETFLLIAIFVIMIYAHHCLYIYVTIKILQMSTGMCYRSKK